MNARPPFLVRQGNQGHRGRAIRSQRDKGREREKPGRAGGPRARASLAERAPSLAISRGLQEQAVDRSLLGAISGALAFGVPLGRGQEKVLLTLYRQARLWPSSVDSPLWRLIDADEGSPGARRAVPFWMLED